MSDNFCDIIVVIAIIYAIGLAILGLICLGYSIYGCFAVPYIISTDDNAYYIEEYKKENGYYYAITIHGDKYKIPI